MLWFFLLKKLANLKKVFLLYLVFPQRHCRFTGQCGKGGATLLPFRHLNLLMRSFTFTHLKYLPISNLSAWNYPFSSRLIHSLGFNIWPSTICILRVGFTLDDSRFSAERWNSTGIDHTLKDPLQISLLILSKSTRINWLFFRQNSSEDI